MSEKSEKSYPSWELPEIRIRVSPKLHNDLQNIADHSGLTLNDFARSKLSEIAVNSPDQLKLPLKKD